MQVVIVGAGIAGLAAAGALRRAGAQVTVLDKGRSPGGRLATRRIGGARLDHGAQFFTVRSGEFGRLVDALRTDGLIRQWSDGFQRPDGYPRYVVAGGMNALAKRLAEDLDVRTAAMAFAVRPSGGGWSVQLDDGSSFDAEAVLLTCPLPQTLSLLVTSGASVPEELAATDYDRTIAWLAVLDRPSAVPAPGGLQAPTDELLFVADHQSKRISEVPALTVHASAGWSLTHWDEPVEVAAEALHRLAEPWLGQARVLEWQIKRWRFATPQRLWPERCFVTDGTAPLALAGDAFAGPKQSGSNLEGAYLSGLAAAEALLGR